MDLEIGSTFGGDLRVLSRFEVGLEDAFLVREGDDERGEQRVVQLFFPWLVVGDEGGARWQVEMTRGNALGAAQFVEVLRAGVDAATSVPFVVLPVLRERTLELEIMRRGKMLPREVARVLEGVAQALSLAHREGLTHGLLSPAHVVIDDSLRARVLHLGLDRAQQRSESAHRLGLFSAAYAAPEQPTHPGAATPAVDTWALGMITFHALVGAPYWEARGMEGLHQTLRGLLMEPMLSPTTVLASASIEVTVPAGFDGWFAEVTAADPSARPSIGDAARSFARMLESPTIAARRAHFLRQAEPGASRFPPEGPSMMPCLSVALIPEPPPSEPEQTATDGTYRTTTSIVDEPEPQKREQVSALLTIAMAVIAIVLVATLLWAFDR